MGDRMKPGKADRIENVGGNCVESSVESSAESADDRRAEEDRRRPRERRRSAKGLFELRARRDRVVEDRRQADRRSGPRFKLAFWRRSASDA